MQTNLSRSLPIGRERLLIFLGLLLALLTFGFASSAVAQTPDARTPETAIPLSGPVTGSIGGQTTGSFLYYSFYYPGNQSLGKLTISVQPADRSTANAVGATIWLDGKILNTTNAVGDTMGTGKVGFATTKAGPALVQVYNYTPGTPVSFTLSVDGIALAAVPALVSAGPAPTEAPAPPTIGKVVGGILPGNTSGRFEKFTVAYPGDNQPRKATLYFTPPGDEIGTAVVFEAYQDGKTLGSTRASQGPVIGEVSIIIQTNSSSPVLLSVGNYNRTGTIEYRIVYE